MMDVMVNATCVIVIAIITLLLIGELSRGE